DAQRLIRNLVANIDLDRPDESIDWFERALSQQNTAGQDPSARLVNLIRQTLANAPIKAVAPLLSATMRLAQLLCPPSMELGVWLRLLSLAKVDNDEITDERWASTLQPFLAHTRHRELTSMQLTALSDRALGNTE